LLFLLIVVANCSACNFHKQNAKLKEIIQRVIVSLGPGVCSDVVLNKVNLHLFSSNVIGRNLPIGSFTSPQIAFEYLYAFICQIQGLPARPNTLTKATITHLMFDPHLLLASMRLDAYLTGPIRLTIFAYLAFNKNNEICGYDFQVRNAGLTLDQPPAAETPTINEVCGGIQAVCTGNNTQYASVADCITFMHQIPYGSYDRGDQDNVVCRTIHLQLAQLVPAVHCPHCGPTGGGMCTNKTAESYYNPPDYLGCAAKRC